jgi:hypothetical protein
VVEISGGDCRVGGDMIREELVGMLLLLLQISKLFASISRFPFLDIHAGTMGFNKIWHIHRIRSF